MGLDAVVWEAGGKSPPKREWSSVRGEPWGATARSSRAVQGHDGEWEPLGRKRLGVSDETPRFATRTREDVDSSEGEEPVEPGRLRIESDGGYRIRFRRSGQKQLPGSSEPGLDIAPRREAVVADADEPLGEDMEEKPPDELESVEGQDLLLLAVRVVPEAEADPAILEGCRCPITL